MRTIEFKFMDKTGWPEGPWMNEPDKKQWLDMDTGLPCLVVRVPQHGALCGYVGVSKDHSLFEKTYHDRENLGDVHGGLTFTGFCMKDPTSVCHLVDDGEEDKVWWFGFDCVHSNDLSPIKADSFWREILGDSPSSSGQYRNFEFVTNEVKRLAKALKAA